MPYCVVDNRIVVNVLVLVCNYTTVAKALTAFTLEHEIEFVARNTVVQCDDIMVDTAVSLLLDINVGNAHILGVGLLQTVQFETGIVANISLYNLCGEKIKVVGGVVTEKHRCLSALLKYDEHTTVDHQIDIGTQNIDHLDSAVGFDVLGNIDERRPGPALC